MAPEIKNQIEQLLAKTREGKIDWKQINQNAIRWTTGLEGKIYNTLLQEVPMGMVNNKPTFQYIFSVQSNTGEMVLQITSNAQVNSEYMPVFQQLFEMAAEKTKTQSAEILNKLMKSIP